MTIIGYATVSTTDQNTESQVERLKRAGCEIVREEKVSGRSRDGRTELETILEFIRPGDALEVVKLDKLGRIKISAMRSNLGPGPIKSLA